MRTRSLIGLLAFGALLGGCAAAEAQPGGSSPAADPRTQWEQAGIVDYSYVYYTGCGERAIGWFEVSVRDGEIVEVAGLDESGRELVENVNPPRLREIVLTVDGLWDELDRAAADAEQVDVEFDGAYGYPVRIDIDWDLRTIDDEICYEITDFVPE